MLHGYFVLTHSNDTPGGPNLYRSSVGERRPNSGDLVSRLFDAGFHARKTFPDCDITSRPLPNRSAYECKATRDEPSLNVCF
jgi:hypothetical protein